MNSKILNGFTEHGAEFLEHTSDQSRGTCPFCSREKFFVDPETGLWDCKTCATAGNFDKFLTLRMEGYMKDFRGAPVFALSKSRNIKPQTFAAWGVGYCIFSKQYMLAMNFNTSRTVKNIARYKLDQKAIGTSSGHSQLFAPNTLYNSKRVWIHEGPWDGMAFSECVSGEDVVSCPGVGNFPKDSLEFFADKDVVILGDNDKPNKLGKKPGDSGIRRTGSLLSGTAKSIKYMHWPKEIPMDGYGIRQLHRDNDGDGEKTLDYVLANIHTEPPPEFATETSTAHTIEAIEAEGVDNTPAREDTIAAYRKWLYLPNPEVLDVIYGSAFANLIQTDPLWLFLVGPPGSCKTELLQSISSSPKMMGATTMTPQALVSGANHSSGDPSLIPKLNGKTLIIKDFTTILTMNPSVRDEIFGILRDAYDGKIEKHFGNGAHRLYYSRFGILAGVTSKIEELSATNSALGERFIKFRIKQPGKIDVGREAIKKSLMGVLTSTQMREELKQIGNKVLNRTISQSQIPRPTPAIAERLLLLAQFIAALRGVVSRDRYTQNVLNKPQSEIGTRLAKQLCSLSMGISLYKKDQTITEETMQTIANVARDTAPDRVEEVVKQLYVLSLPDKTKFFTNALICEKTRLPQTTISSLLQDLNMLHVVKCERGERAITFRLDFSIISLIEKAKIYAKEKEWHLK